MLIAAGGEALLQKSSQDGRTCLYCACQGGHLQIVKALIEAGGEALLLTTEGVHGGSCLHAACYRGHAAVAALLASLPCAGLVGLRDRYGLTALDLAVINGHVGAAEAVRAASRRPAPPRSANPADPGQRRPARGRAEAARP
jgi:ankyrin repeat protein